MRNQWYGAVHQFCQVGSHVMVGSCSGVAQDVPPFVIAQGNHATLWLNIRKKRRGFAKKICMPFVTLTRYFYRNGKTLEEAEIAHNNNNRVCKIFSIFWKIQQNQTAVLFAN